MLFSHLGEGLCQPFWAHKNNNSSHLNSIIEFIKLFHVYYQWPGESGMICMIIPFYSSGEVKWFVQGTELLGVSQYFQQCCGSGAFHLVECRSSAVNLSKDLWGHFLLKKNIWHRGWTLHLSPQTTEKWSTPGEEMKLRFPRVQWWHRPAVRPLRTHLHSTAFYFQEASLNIKCIQCKLICLLKPSKNLQALRPLFYPY